MGSRRHACTWECSVNRYRFMWGQGPSTGQFQSYLSLPSVSTAQAACEHGFLNTPPATTSSYHSITHPVLVFLMYCYREATSSASMNSCISRIWERQNMPTLRMNSTSAVTLAHTYVDPANNSTTVYNRELITWCMGYEDKDMKYGQHASFLFHNRGQRPCKHIAWGEASSLNFQYIRRCMDRTRKVCRACVA